MENQLVGALLLENNQIEVNYVSEDINSISFTLTSDGINQNIHLVDIISTNEVHKIIFACENPIELGHIYRIKTSEEEETILRLDRYVASKEFDELYFYDGELGLNYQKDESTFRLWSPTSEKVFLKLEKGDNNFVMLPMKRKEKGVFTITVKGDLFNKKYNYVIVQNNAQKVITDPYGYAVDANSEHSVVIDISDIKNMGTVKPTNEIKNQSSAVIYELHIRDFTEGDKSISNSGTYLSVLQKVDYLKRLGITHVQLLPVIDYDAVDDYDKSLYNWGYNPISFFALEGSYSQYPEDGLARLIEFKTLVNELHKNNIRVVLDVVYNHLYDYITNNFQKNVPYYFFRRAGKRMANASGCGNDVASERKMVRRIICDSIRYFLEVFDVDGFRFDLLGLIDIETSKEIVKIRNELKKDALLYGEGWNMGVELKAEQKTSSDNAHLIPEMGFFNDKFRDVIKGSTFDHYSPGFILGNRNNHFEIEDVLFGSMLSHRYDSINQSINYVECHDNQTLFDKLSYFDESVDANLKRVTLANIVIILSLGVPFIHMGQEIGQSKELLDNTYNIPKINNMNWKLVEERSKMVDVLADAIKLRKALNYAQANSIEEILDGTTVEHMDNGLLVIKTSNKRLQSDGEKAVLVININEESSYIDLEEDYYLYFSSSIGLITDKNYYRNLIVPGLSIEVLRK